MAAQIPAEAHITHDPAYETVAPDDFLAMVAVERYPRRSDAFDAITRPPRPISISRRRSIWSATR